MCCSICQWFRNTNFRETIAQIEESLCSSVKTMAEIVIVEEPMSHGDDAPVGDVTWVVKGLTTNTAEESVINDVDIPNEDKALGNCVVLWENRKNCVADAWVGRI